MLKALVIGYGHMGRRRAEILGERGDATVVAIVDHGAPPPEPCGSTVAFARELRDVEIPIDVAVVATQPDNHVAIAIDLVNRGVDVFVEKPLGLTRAGAVALGSAARERGRIVAVGYSERHNPAFVTARRLIEAGAIGEVEDITVQRLGPSAPKRRAGIVHDLATHDLDLLAVLGLAGLPVHAVDADRVEGLRRFRAELRGDGRRVRLVVGDAPVSLRSWSITGRLGRLDLDLRVGDVTHTQPESGRGVAIPHEGGERRELEAELDQFFDTVRGSGRSSATCDDAVAVHALVEELLDHLSPRARAVAREAP